MTPINMNDPNSPLKWTEEILKTASKIDKATTGALAAAAGASLVLGFVSGGLFWMPFGAFASALAYRGVRYYEERQDRWVIRQIRTQEWIRLQLIELDNSSLPDAQKQQLYENLNQISVESTQRKRLPNP